MGYKIKAQSVRITDDEAIRLINERAQRETRTAANAASVTVIEALGKPSNKQNNIQTQLELSKVKTKETL